MKKKYAVLCLTIIFSLIFGACSSGGAPPAPAATASSAAQSTAPSAAPAAPAPAMPAPAAPAEAPAGEAEVDMDEPDIAPYTAQSIMMEEPQNSGYRLEYGDMSPDISVSGEKYLSISENAPVSTSDESMTTFSLKVDTAAYTNVTRYINSGMIPPADAVRIEEMINYFSYDGKVQFSGKNPFGVYAELGVSPFDPGKYMAFIRVRSKDIDKSELPASNLTFLIDTSGSMSSYDKLPLLKEAFALLVETLDENDRVSIVTYAGKAGVVLDSVPGSEKQRILDAINMLESSGSTGGQGGIMAAYALAEKNFVPGGNNRVILATDGDFNVGMSTTGELEGLISRKKDSGVYLSVLGVGSGNIRDDIMETLAKNGNGNYSYINSAATAKKVLVDEMGQNLFTIADDVKAQIEFNPRHVKSYRLIGYENRALENRDFADDTKDAGEIGLGTDVVVMFELELQGRPGELTAQIPGASYADELFEVRIRYKEPGGTVSTEMRHPVKVDRILSANTSDFGFACSVAGFGHLLRQSPYAGNFTVVKALAMAEQNLGADESAYRLSYLNTLEQYRGIIG